jgi:hypothetical protein
MAVVLEASDQVVEARPEPRPRAIKPSRLNFARVCLRCDERDCTARECIAWHAESCWAICEECDGLCWTHEFQPCGCLFGVVEMYPSSERGRPVGL